MECVERLQKLQLENARIVEVTREDLREVDFGEYQLDTLLKFCRIKIEARPSEDSLILSELWLPDEWNGIFVGTGNGGLGGGIYYRSLCRYLHLGYATANTNLGTSEGHSCGIGRPEIWKDYGWRATHLMAVNSKKIIEAYYGKKADYSYFIGESTGGQQANMTAQRFPEDYDGIFAGVPAQNRTHLHVMGLWMTLHLRGKDGNGVFSKEEIAKIHDCAVDFFQARGDGQKGDLFVSFPYTDEDTVEDFLNYLRKHCPEISEEQLVVLQKVYQGPVDPVTGKQIYCGIPIGSEVGCNSVLYYQKGELKNYIIEWALGKEFDLSKFDFHDDVKKLDETLAKDINANNPDLSAFRDHGGVMLISPGSSDPDVAFPDALRYYESVLDRMGGYEEVSKFCRFFLCPGKDHNICGRGATAWWGNTTDRFNVLDVLRAWREKGIAPEKLFAVRYGEQEWWVEIDWIREVYPYGSKQSPRRPYPPSTDESFLIGEWDATKTK